VKPKTVNIKQQASNLGSIKGLPGGSGHGGFVIDAEVDASEADKLRNYFATGGVVHIRDRQDSDYILKDFLGSDKVQASHICPIKTNQAREDDFSDSLQDIISSIDTLPIDEVQIQNVFDDEERAADFFIMKTEQVQFEYATKFDKTLSKIYKHLL